eukprot:scaffold422_cov399-Prasinococcus_capsulatus_cf.AAC.13
MSGSSSSPTWPLRPARPAQGSPRVGTGASRPLRPWWPGRRVASLPCDWPSVISDAFLLYFVAAPAARPPLLGRCAHPPTGRSGAARSGLIRMSRRRDERRAPPRRAAQLDAGAPPTRPPRKRARALRASVGGGALVRALEPCRTRATQRPGWVRLVTRDAAASCVAHTRRWRRPCQLQNSARPLYAPDNGIDCCQAPVPAAAGFPARAGDGQSNRHRSPRPLKHSRASWRICFAPGTRSETCSHPPSMLCHRKGQRWCTSLGKEHRVRWTGAGQTRSSLQVLRR